MLGRVQLLQPDVAQNREQRSSDVTVITRVISGTERADIGLLYEVRRTRRIAAQDDRTAIQTLDMEKQATVRNDWLFCSFH